MVHDAPGVGQLSRSRLPGSELPAATLPCVTATTGGEPPAIGYSTNTRSPALRPKVSGMYISSALAGGTTKLPGVVARA